MADYISDVRGIGTHLGGLARTTTGAVKSYMGTSVHRAGMRAIKDYMIEPFKPSAGMFSRMVGFAGMGYYAYEGYQQGGMAGAAKGLVRGAAESYIFGAALKATGVSAAYASIPLAGAGVLAGSLFYLESLNQGVGMGQLAARPFVHEYMRKRATLEMGSPIQDQYGTAATMRRRSIMAMRESRITARSSLGMEGNRRYVPYMR